MFGFARVLKCNGSEYTRLSLKAQQLQSNDKQLDVEIFKGAVDQ